MVYCDGIGSFMGTQRDIQVASARRSLWPTLEQRQRFDRRLRSDLERILTHWRPGRGGWALLVCGMAVLAVRYSWRKGFSLDEFQYAHAAWALGRGQLPYVDFFEVHFPLVYWYLAPLSRLAGDDPSQILLFRIALLPILLIGLLGIGALNRTRDTVAVFGGPLLLLVLPPFLGFATENPAGCHGGGAVLWSVGRSQAQRRGVRIPATGTLALGVIGVLLAAAAWSAQKASFCASALVLCAGLDALRVWRGLPPRFVGHPKAFFVALVTVGAAVLAWLMATGSLSAFWHWCFVWAVGHQQHYPGFSPWRYFQPVLQGQPWFFALALLGLVQDYRQGRLRSDGLLLVSWVMTALSFLLQRAAFPYSFLPFLGLTAVYAARGVGLVIALPRQPSMRALTALAACAVLGSLANDSLRALANAPNDLQLAVFQTIQKLTSPDDAAYDNSGGYISRPHAYFYYYTDLMIRGGQGDQLSREVPAAIAATGAVMSLADRRDRGLPAELKQYLQDHFQPYDRDISLWGRRYVSENAAPLRTSFVATKAGTYFVSPEDLLSTSTLLIDGVPLSKTEVALQPGEHTVEYRGPSKEFYILWLPEIASTGRLGRAPSPGSLSCSRCRASLRPASPSRRASRFPSGRPTWGSCPWPPRPRAGRRRCRCPRRSRGP